MPQQEPIEVFEPNLDGHSEAITPREREVAELIAQGLTNEQIAERLVLTPGTVANHVAHILSKLRLQSRVQVAVKIANAKSRSDAETVLVLLGVLRQVDSTSAHGAMQHATNVLASAFAADKVDAFVYVAQTDMLEALGTSDTPLGRLQAELGLDKVPVADGGRAAWVFREQRPFRHGHVEDDLEESVGVRRDLGVRSTIAVPIQASEHYSGVLLVSSRQPDHFTQDQLHLLQFVAYWIGLVARDQSTNDGRHDGGSM
jgi:DNA-binding CsgD family transcriptional regulator